MPSNGRFSRPSSLKLIAAARRTVQLLGRLPWRDHQHRASESEGAADFVGWAEICDDQGSRHHRRDLPLRSNSYGKVRCSNTSARTCSGTLEAYSVALDYRFAKRFDAYAGVMFSRVADGLASGFLNTSTADPMG